MWVPILGTEAKENKDITLDQKPELGPNKVTYKPYSVAVIHSFFRYQRCFAHCKNEKVILEVEASPSYLYYRQATYNIKSDTKIVILLRDPVERVISMYRYFLKLKKEELSLEDALKAEPQRIKEGWEEAWVALFKLI